MNNLEKILGPASNWINNNRIIQSISKGLMSLMSVLILGSFATIFQNLPIEAYQSFLTTSGLGGIFTTLSNITINLLALYAAFSIAYTYVGNFSDYDSFTGGLLGLLAFLLVTPLTTTGEGFMAITNLPLEWLGAKGIFVAMFCAIVSAIIYIKLSDKGLIVKLPDSVPEFVAKSFNGIIPSVLIGILFGAITLGLSHTEFENFHNAVYTLIGSPLSVIGTSIWAGIIIYVLTGLCWFLGIHGIAVVSVIMPVWIAADAENMAAVAAGQVGPNIITYNWINAVSSPGGAGATIGLVICVLLFAKSSRYKIFGKVATIPSLFNINEPVVFGFPMMLNPILFIPFVFTPVLFIIIGYILTSMGILPMPTGAGGPGGTPLIIQGLMMGGWKYAVFQLIATIVSTLIYFPFFKVLDKKAVEEEMKSNDVKISV